ncbi:MAG: hypothetical protein ABEJ68_05050 [Halobacteriaceae archaeon]
MGAPPTTEGGTIAFSARDDPPGLVVRDRIEQHKYTLNASDSVSPRAVDTERFVFPVDAATAISTAEIRLPTVVITCIRDAVGDTVARTEHSAEVSLPPDAYELELHAPIRMYLRVESGVDVVADGEHTRIDFGDETTVEVGVRSDHERPAATVQTTSDPRDLMRAVSTFGSALKTTSPERAFPTFRGHPPAVELADEFSVPAEVEPPDTGVTIEVPPERRYVYVVAPLAYYLGATVEPGETPRLVTDAGFEYELGADRAFEQSVERVLKQVFVLDCVTRTEGLYEVSFKTRQALADDIDFDPAVAYDRPLAERLETYLAEEYDAIEPAIPDWKLTSHVSLDPTSAETLPYLVNDLAIVRTPGSTSAASSPSAKAAIDEFLRDGDSFVRSTTDGGTAVDRDFVQADEEDALEHAWVGEETPVGMSKVTETAYQHQFDREPTDGDIEITVVCNDPEMAAEQDLLQTVYGTRERLPFDIEFEEGLPTDALRETLAADVDFLHYVGHIDDGGFRCPDGVLDATTLDEVGVDAFLLNACQSYDQGLGLINAGAIAGITTLSDVPNEAAVEMGYTISRLLNSGFPIRGALEVAKEEHIIGSQYVVVGDGGMTITQAESGTAQLYELERTDDGFALDIIGYASSNFGMGALFTPFISDDAPYYLNSGHLDRFELTAEELSEFLMMENVPVRFDGELHWSYDLSVSALDD